MGMSIEETRRELISDKPDTYKFAMALVVAIDTMRKYQKIEQIVNVWHQDIYAKDFECIAELAEVVEDGKID